MYMRMNRRNMLPGFTASDLQLAKTGIADFAGSFQVLFADPIGLNLDTEKFHRLSHFHEIVRWTGSPAEFNTDHFETEHKTSKNAYRYESWRVDSGSMSLASRVQE